MSRRHLCALLLATGFVGGCDARQTLVEPDPHLQRMLAQRKVEAYERPMRRPPQGTVPNDRVVGDLLLAKGMEKGEYARTIPIPVTMDVLRTGRTRFDTFCATCHGVLGDGKSPVADNFELRKPRSLHDDEVREEPPGHLFRTISEGYGLMPAYDAQLSLEDRWAVVAYVRALQLSRHAPLAALTPEERLRLDRGRTP